MRYSSSIRLLAAGTTLIALGTPALALDGNDLVKKLNGALYMQQGAGIVPGSVEVNGSNVTLRNSRFEAGTGQGLGDQAGVVDGGRELAARISALPDHERQPLFGSRVSRRAGNRRQTDSKEKAEPNQIAHVRETLRPRRGHDDADMRLTRLNAL